MSVSIRRCGITAVNRMLAFNVVILTPDTEWVHKLGKIVCFHMRAIVPSKLESSFWKLAFLAFLQVFVEYTVV